MNKKLLITASVFIFVIIAYMVGQSFFSDNKNAVIQLFLKEHPKAIVETIFLGDGTFDYLEYHIVFRESPNAQSETAIWVYAYLNGEWKVISRSTLPNENAR